MHKLLQSSRHLARPRCLLPNVSTNCRRWNASQAIPQPKHGLKLRDYQEECVQTVVKSLNEGRRQVGISLATGAGKTVIFTELIERVPCPTSEATQTLILVHRRELVEQAARHCSNRYPNMRVDIEMGNLHATGRADITIASVQSMISKDRMEKFDPRRFKLVLVDEAHHIVADGYLRVLDHFGLQSGAVPATPALVGVSATFSRHDGLALGKAIKHIVYHKDYIDMIGANFLSNVIFTTVKSRADLSKVKVTSAGDFNSTSLSRAVNTDEANLATVMAWRTRAQDRKSTLVFCVDIAHLLSLTAVFRRFGVHARYVTGDTPSIERSKTLDEFKQRKLPVLLNCGVFTEGTDIPNIDCVLLARPTKSRNLLVQMIGRGMRLYDGKENCHIIDMVSSIESGIITTPTLFGLDPAEIISNADAKALEDRKSQRQQELILLRQQQEQGSSQSLDGQSPSSTTLSFRDYDSVEELISESSSERHIRAISPHSWVGVGDNRFILMNGGNGSYLKLEQSSEKEYSVTHTMRLPPSPKFSKAPFSKPRKILSVGDFESAVHGADTFAKSHFHRVFIVSHGPSSRWRDDPASQAQVDFLNKMRPSDDQLIHGQVSKGKAGDMITKIKFGARGRFKSLEQSKRRQKRMVGKRAAFEKVQDRERVRVGPLSVDDQEQ